MEKMVEFPADSLRAAHHGHAAELAGSVVNGFGSRHWKLLDIVFEITCDEEIQPTIAVVVAKGRAGGPCAEGYASFLRYVGEGAIGCQLTCLAIKLRVCIPWQAGSVPTMLLPRVQVCRLTGKPLRLPS